MSDQSFKTNLLSAICNDFISKFPLTGTTVFLPPNVNVGGFNLRALTVESAELILSPDDLTASAII
jgi:hypothetical protein